MYVESADIDSQLLRNNVNTKWFFSDTKWHWFYIYKVERSNPVWNEPYTNIMKWTPLTDFILLTENKVWFSLFFFLFKFNFITNCPSCSRYWSSWFLLQISFVDIIFLAMCLRFHNLMHMANITIEKINLSEFYDDDDGKDNDQKNCKLKELNKNVNIINTKRKKKTKPSRPVGN